MRERFASLALERVGHLLRTSLPPRPRFALRTYIAVSTFATSFFAALTLPLPLPLPLRLITPSHQRRDPRHHRRCPWNSCPPCAKTARLPTSKLRGRRLVVTAGPPEVVTVPIPQAVLRGWLRRTCSGTSHLSRHLRRHRAGAHLRRHRAQHAERRQVSQLHFAFV